MFIYVSGGIQWTTADSSNGTNGFGGDEATTAIIAGDGVNLIVINGSRTPSIINITQTSNVGIPGVWMFKIGEGMCILCTLTNNYRLKSLIFIFKFSSMLILLMYYVSMVIKF